MRARTALTGFTLTALVLLTTFGGSPLASGTSIPPGTATPSGWAFTASPLWTTNVSEYNFTTRNYGPTACAQAAVPLTPHFSSATLTSHARVWAKLNVTAACRMEYVSSSAQAFVQFSSPILLTSSNHSVTVNWSANFAASEWIHKQRAGCPGAFHQSCTTSAEFVLYESAYVWDNTSGYAYCPISTTFVPGPASTGMICGPSTFRVGVRCDSSYGMGYFCHPFPSSAVTGTLNGSSVIPNSDECSLSSPGTMGWCLYYGAPGFNASHQYTLNLTVGAIAYCTSDGYVATAYASVDLARPDVSRVTGITVS